MRRPGPNGKALRGRSGRPVRGPAAGLVTEPETLGSAANVGLLVTSALVPGTFAPSLSARSAADQGIVTGLSAGLHYLLTVGTQDTLQAVVAMLSRDPALCRDPAFSRSRALSRGPVLPRDPALSRGPALSRSPALSRGPDLSRDAALSGSPALSRGTALFRNTVLSGIALLSRSAALSRLSRDSPGPALSSSAAVGTGMPAASRRRTLTFAVDCAAIPAGLLVQRLLPVRPGEAMLRGMVRQVGWRFATTGLGGALLIGAEAGVARVDARLGAGGRIASFPLAVPVGLGVGWMLERRHSQRPGTEVGPEVATEAGPEAGAVASAAPLRSLAVAGGLVGGMTGAAYAEHRLASLFGRRMAAVLPGPAEAWTVLGHGGFLAALAAGTSTLWHRTTHRLEAGASADEPVIESGEATRWVGPTISGGPGSLVPWATLGREGRRHALVGVQPQPVADRPAGTPDLSVQTVMGEPARATPVQVYVGLDSAGTARDRVDLAMAEMERTGAFDRSLIILVSPTGTGYVNYVAVAAAQYLTLGDVATVSLQYSKRPSPLSLGMISAAREQNRLLWLHVLQRVRDRPEPRPRVVLFGESLGAHTSQDVFLHWGTLGLQALGIDRALWIGTPYGSQWMHQVTGADRLDVDPDAVAVVNDFAQLERLGPQRRSRLRYVLLSHDNDGVAKFGTDLLTTPPGWLGPDRPPPETAEDGSPRGIPAGMRWRPITTFFQTLVDMKNAQVPGPYRSWAHDYRPELPRFVSEVFGLPATPDQLARVEAAVQEREDVRRQLFRAGEAKARTGK